MRAAPRCQTPPRWFKLSNPTLAYLVLPVPPHRIHTKLSPWITDYLSMAARLLFWPQPSLDNNKTHIWQHPLNRSLKLAEMFLELPTYFLQWKKKYSHWAPRIGECNTEWSWCSRLFSVPFFRICGSESQVWYVHLFSTCPAVKIANQLAVSLEDRPPIRPLKRSQISERQWPWRSG